MPIPIPTLPLSIAHLCELGVKPADLIDLAARAGFASVGLRTAAVAPGGVSYPLGSAAEQAEMRRRMAFLQQKPVLFNANVFENVAYGLRCRGVSDDVIRETVNDTLKIVGLHEYGNRTARTLSGGEAQRVAIARAVILKPEVLILDELTANLDPVSTAKIEELIETIIGKRDTTIIMSTHDMVQGQRLADRIGVLLSGELLQTGRATEVFISPGNKAVAEFVGVENIIPGVVRSCIDGLITVAAGGGHLIEAVSEYPDDEKVDVLMRPEDITLSLTRTSTSARNTFNSEITRMVSMGPLIKVELDGGCRLVVLITKRSAGEMGLKIGSRVFASFKATAIHVIKRN